MAFLAYVAAALCFFLAATGLTTATHLIEWGLFAVAAGLLLDAWSPGFLRRRP